jgi:NADH-quinone oxidoreductase subunit N
MKTFFFIKNVYINEYLWATRSELFKLVEAIDYTNPLIYLSENISVLSQPTEHFRLLWQLYVLFPEEYELLENDFGSIILTNLPIAAKIILMVNIMLVKSLFLQVTPLTFWVFPSFLLLLCGIILLLFIWPAQITTFLWEWSKRLLTAICVYQGLLIFLYFSIANLGFFLRVGLLGAFFLPINLSVVKLLIFSLVLLSLLITIFFYLDYYANLLNLVKPELCSIILFLGFGSGLVLLQNDLFALFLYFEIISFCIYGLLFLQKRTTIQLNALVRYVLYSLWISTCYLIGIAFYLAAANINTTLFELGNPPLHFETWTVNTLEHRNLIISNLRYLLLNSFELILAITFITIYFLFKLGAGPFYTWTIEVYNACPTGTLLAVSLIPKLIYLPILFFLLFFNFIEYHSYWSGLLFITGLTTIFIGAFGILLTDKLKELYAWSSLIHTGNMLILLSCLADVTLSFLSFYLISYFLISTAFILLITSIWNKFTGWFVKTITELNSLSSLHPIIYMLAIILIASAAGFTPFLSFFMKFSILMLVTNHYGIIFTIIIGLLNIIGSVAYLWLLRFIIGFNLNTFDLRSADETLVAIEAWMSYRIAWLFNAIIVIITSSFFFL